jgi:hypothetical protein
LLPFFEGYRLQFYPNALNFFLKSPVFYPAAAKTVKIPGTKLEYHTPR